ncbi:hypothetical protein LCGC14_1833130, partial [marine sediment metagenome]
LCGLDRGSSYDILTNKQENELNDSTDKAKQAIIDYVEKEKEKLKEKATILRVPIKAGRRLESLSRFIERIDKGETAIILGEGYAVLSNNWYKQIRQEAVKDKHSMPLTKDLVYGKGNWFCDIDSDVKIAFKTAFFQLRDAVTEDLDLREVE